jgi:hypothetical protein
MSDSETNQSTQVNTKENSTAMTPSATDPVMTTDQALLKLISTNKKQLFYQRILALAAVGIFVVILYTVMTVVPRITATLTNLDGVVADAGNSLKEIDKMVAEMESASKNLNELVDANAEPLTDAVEKLGNVDFDGLNQAITDLQDAVHPMASFFNKFR